MGHLITRSFMGDIKSPYTYNLGNKERLFIDCVSSWELMFPETDSSIYICMIRQKEQIYPPARVINPSPSISDGAET